MAVERTDKAIVIIEDKQVLDPVEIALKQRNLSAAKEYMNLFSTSIIRTQMKNTNDITFLAGELKRFVREQGFPYAFILDGRIDCGLGKNDPDGIMIFKTILLTSMVLAKGRGYENFKCNMLLLAGPGDEARLKNLALNPQSVLAILSSPDKSMAGLIGEYKKDVHKFGKRFYIECSRTDLTSSEIIRSVDKFITEIEARDDLTKLKAAGKEVDSVSTEPAAIVIKGADGTIFVDGIPSAEGRECYGSMKTGEYYVVGNWTSRTQLLVSKKIARLIFKGFPGTEPYEKSDRIVVNLDRNTHIDASIATSLASLLSIELKEYKNMIVIVSGENGFRLKNSPGFSLVRKQVRITG